MLTINRKLGYRPEPGWYHLVRDLAKEMTQVENGSVNPTL
jgi:hypothetical protein